MSSKPGWSVRPTAWGVAVVVVLVGAAVLRPAVADPSYAAMTWAAMLAGAVIGVVWPAVGVWSVRATTTSPVADCDVSTPAAVDVSIRSVAPALEVSWNERESGWYRIGPRYSGSLTLLPRRRGVRTVLLLAARSAGPLGLVSFTRTLALELQAAFHVGPEPTDAVVLPRSSDEAGDVAASRSGLLRGDQVRSVRPYVTGDPSHLVHWPTSARVGAPMIRELEPPVRPGVVLILDLGPRPQGADATGSAVSPTTDLDDEGTERVEQACRRAAGLGRGVQRSGGSLVLCTSVGGRGVSARCDTPEDLRRRLAAADRGPVAPTHPTGWYVEVVRP